MRRFVAGLAVAGGSQMLGSAVDLQVIGQWQAPSFAMDLAVDGEFAYMVDHSEGLQILSVSNPAHPQKVGSLRTSSGTWSVALSGSYAYVAADESGLHVIDVLDVRNPHQPERIQSLSMDGRGTACAMVVQGSFIYLAFQGLEIVQLLERPSFAVPVLDVSGSLRLRVSGEVGETVRVQYSDNLQEWIDWQTVSFTSPDLDLIDERGRPEGRRFYRAVAP